MDTLIHDLLAKRNYTQARKAIEKKLKQKKFENNSSLLIAKAKVQLGLAEYEACLALCAELCQRKSPLTDIDEVNDLYELLRQLAELQKLDEALYEKSWKGAVLAQPKGQMQHEWAEEWATQATRHQHWTLLSRAAITMRQLWMPNSEVWRKYTYVMITAQWLASRGTSTGQNSGEDRMMALNGTLAIRQMDDAVKAMEANQNGNTAPSAAKLRIEKQAELKLFIHMCLANGILERVVEALNGVNAQKLVKGDDDLAIHIQDATMKTKTPTEGFQWLRNVVEKMRELPDSDFRIDDWEIWKSLLGLKEHCEEKDNGDAQQMDSDIRQLVQDHIITGKVSRAPRLASLELQCAATSGTSSQSQDVSQALLAHFGANTAQGFIADDLGRHLNKLDMSTYQHLRLQMEQPVRAMTSKDEMQDSAQLKWLTAEINLLKVDSLYFQQITAFHTTSEVANSLLESIIVNSLRLYTLSRAHTAKIHEKAVHPGDEACLIAVEALLMLGRRKNLVVPSTLQALCLLEFVLADNKHNFLARTQLTGLLQTFSLYTQASQAYMALDVKEILHETMAPLLFLRIGSAHPPGLKAFNAYDASTKALDFYTKAVDKVPDYQTMAFDHENYEQVIQMNQFRDQLRLSPTRLMLLFERKRLARLVHNQMAITKATIDHAEVAHNLRKQYNGSAEVAVRASPDRHPGPPLSKQYNEWLIFVDLVYDLARQEPLDLASLAEQARLAAPLSTLLHSSDLEHLTESERTILKAAESMMTIVLHISGLSELSNVLESSTEVQTLETTFTALLNKFSDLLHDSPDLLPRWQLYHDSCLTLELCQTIDALANKMQKAKAGHKKELEAKGKSLKSAYQILFDTVQKVWTKQKQAIAEYDNSGDLLQAIMGGDDTGTREPISQAVYEVMGVRNVQRSLQGYVSGVKIAIDAVLGIKLRR